MAAKRRAQQADTSLRPFLKWAGNKFRILDRILEHLPEGRRLVEPFAGSGAVFLNTDFKRYLLADANRDLVDLYTLLRDEGKPFVDYASRLFTPENNQSARYYALREEFNRCVEPRRRAALFLYLNRHGYNGLCRYNASGGFNVPFGRYKHPYFPAAEMLAFHRKARQARFLHQDFETTFRKARAGDVIYCDPPYVPLSSSANFTSYSAGGFTLEQQARLAELSASAARRGITVLISNHNTAFAREIYADAELHTFHVQRYISCNGKKRKRAGELIAVYRQFPQ